ncbi:MAG: DinB family protein [Bryobacterales bacterium]|nr:DinB family protein [Bryobacterales bacterium]MBV9399370.1 DinB family protein [Bryobacterales bacterium]
MKAITLDEFFEYTDWQRRKWSDWFRQHGDGPLDISAGPNGDGRFTSVGDLVKHIFSAEKRYVERLTGCALTDSASISSVNAESLFAFGDQSRKELRQFIEGMPEQDWESPLELKILNHVVKASPRKIVMHVLMHEVRHWAQIHTILRLNGFTGEFHDFLFSPVMGAAGSS